MGRHPTQSGSASSHPRQGADIASILGAGLCIASGALLATAGAFFWAGVLLLAGAVCDLIDGALARRAPVRPIGAFLDSICDKVGDAAIFCGLVIAVDDRLALCLLVVSYALGSLVSYVKAAAGEHGIHVTWLAIRFFGRGGRVAVLVITLLLAGTSPMFGALFWLTVGSATLLAFNVITLAGRLKQVVEAVRLMPQNEAKVALAVDRAEHHEVLLRQ